jgi:hypothetical protein
MSKYKDLIEQLRQCGETRSADGRGSRICDEAADALETLQRERDDLKHDVERYVTISSEEATRAEVMRRERDEAVTALGRIHELVSLKNQEGWKDERHSDWTRGRILAVLEMADLSPDERSPSASGGVTAIAPFEGMDREWTAEEKNGINDALRQYGWKDDPSPEASVSVPVKATDTLLRPFYECPPEELESAWRAMIMVARNTVDQGPLTEVFPVEDCAERRYLLRISSELKRQNTCMLLPTIHQVLNAAKRVKNGLSEEER